MKFANLDRRRVVKHSTRIRIANDRAGRRASRVADKLNEKLEIFWRGLSRGTQDVLAAYAIPSATS